MKDLARFLNPASIAFVGGNECEIAINRTLELGFTGRIWPVNPRRETMAGLPALPSVDAIPGEVDAAYVAVRNDRAVDVVRALAVRGCHGAVVYSSGFAETGNHELQGALLAAADGMPLIGPNCYGFINTAARVAMWPDESGVEPVERGVALITQSGNIAVNFAMMMRNLPVAAILSIGNQADVAMHDLVAALAADSRITAIGLHIEGLTDVSAFAEAAALARHHRKPVVALKTGRSEQGARATMSHTSSLAGADAAYDALFARHGIPRVQTPTALAETLKFLHHGGPIAGSRLVSMSCSGGEAALIADLAVGRALTFPPFPASAVPRIKATLNDYVAIDNPLDYHTFIWDQREKLAATFGEVLKVGFDVGMVILDIPTHPCMKADTWVTTARAMADAAAATGARAAVVASMYEGMPAAIAAELSAANVAPLIGLDDALTAFEAAAQIGRNWAQAEAPLPLSVPSAVAGKAVRTLSEAEAKRRLAGYGLAVPEGRVCAATDAVSVARDLGFPVTLKVSSPDIAHKTEAGGVALNLRTEPEVEAAATRMARLAPDVLVERMVTGVVAELIVGLTTDPQFGICLVVGAGGILAELLRDSATLILPASDSEIEAALTSLRVWRLVEGFRGRSGDAAAVFAAVRAVAAFAADHAGRIEELDVNPLLVLADGAVAVDALIRLRDV